MIPPALNRTIDENFNDLFSDEKDSWDGWQFKRLRILLHFTRRRNNC